MSFIKKCSAFTLLCLSALTFAAPKTTQEQLLRVWPGNASMNIPFAEKAPVTDGFFTPGEWEKAAQFSGFSLRTGNYVTTGTGSLYLMRDRDNLYIAMRTTTPNNDPGGSLVANATQRDGKVFQDDSLDFMILSDHDTNKLYHFIINARNTIYDSLYDVNSKKSDLSWNFKKIRCASHVDKGFWDLEITLPLSEIGIPKKYLKINVGRNWSKAGSSLINPSRNYFDVKRMINLSWNKKGGVLRQFDAGNVGRGEWTLALEADNLSDKELCLAMLLRHTTYKKVNNKRVKNVHFDVMKEVKISPQQSGKLNASFTASGTARYHFTAVLFDPASGRIYSARNFAGTKGNTERHPFSGTFVLKGKGTGEYRYYPGYDKAELFFRPADKKITTAALLLPDGKKVSGIHKKDFFHFNFVVPSTPGFHTFSLELDGKKISDAFKIEKRSYPWLNSGLGKDKIVLPPFAPLKPNGANVKLALSEIKLNSTGVWEEFSAENIPMLASPMVIEAVINGKKEYFNGEIAAPDCEADGYALQHKFNSKTASGAEIYGTSRIEYDGFQYLTLTLKENDKLKIDRLTLRIPLKDSEVPFFHAISNFIRENPSGKIPAGTGLVWDGSKLPRRTALGQETLHPQAVPYIWLGGVTRGVSCFIETTYGYALSRTANAVRLIRNNGVLTLEWDFINTPVTLKKSRSFAFGLMPTPVKKADPALRQYTHDTSGIGARTMKNFTFIGGQLMGFSPWRHDAFAGDFEIFRAACRAVRAGGKDNMAKELDAWLEKYESRMINEMKQVPNSGDYPNHYSKVRKNFRKFQLDNPARRPALPYKYTDPKLTWIFEDIPEYFRAEWFNPAPQSYFGARRISLIPSSLDYMVDALNKELLNGAHGIYLDDMYLMPDTNTATVAKVDSDGNLHPAIGILGMRELVKRIAVLQHKNNLYPRLLQVHMTNALLIPCFSLATSTLGWENHYGDTPLPTRFKIDDILATGTGLQVGAESCVLGGIKRRKLTPAQWKKNYQYLTRTLISLSLPFGAKFKAPVTPAGDARFYFSIISLAGDFGFWKPECRFVPFWEADATDLSVNDKEVLASSWRFPGRVLLVLGNQSGKTKELKLSVNTEKLALKKDFKVLNTETKTVEDSGKIVLAPYDFKLLLLK